MKILNFQNFILNESSSQIYDEITGVNSISDDGYELEVEKFDNENDDAPFGKILLTKDSPNNVRLSFNNYKGKKIKDLWIPKDHCDIKDVGDDRSKITIPGNGKWLSSGDNRAKVEDFIEDLYNSKMRDKLYASDLTDTIRDDVHHIMDIIGIPCEVVDVKKLDGDNEYEVVLDNDISIDVDKRSPKQLLGNFKMYKNNRESSPSVEIKSKNGKHNFYFYNEDLPNLEDEADLSDVKNNHRLYYLLKKSLGVDNSDDKENFYSHFEDKLNNFKDENSENLSPEMKKSRIEDAKKLKDLKSIANTFKDEEEIRKIFPKNLVN
jgi:transcriptional regulator of NAD metabolism